MYCEGTADILDAHGCGVDTHVFISVFIHTHRVLPIHFGRETVPSVCTVSALINQPCSAMLLQWWFTVCDAGTTVNPHRVHVSRFIVPYSTNNFWVHILGLVYIGWLLDYHGNEYMRDTCIHPVKLCITVRVSVRPSSICICMLRGSRHYLGQYCAIRVPPRARATLWIFRGLAGWKLCLRPLRLFYVRL